MPPSLGPTPEFNALELVAVKGAGQLFYPYRSMGISKEQPEQETTEKCWF